LGFGSGGGDASHSGGMSTILGSDGIAISSAESLAVAVGAVAPAVAKVVARAATHVLRQTSSSPSHASSEARARGARAHFTPGSGSSRAWGAMSADSADGTSSEAQAMETDVEDPWTPSQKRRVVGGIADTPESGRARIVGAPSLLGDSPVLEPASDVGQDQLLPDLAMPGSAAAADGSSTEVQPRERTRRGAPLKAPLFPSSRSVQEGSGGLQFPSGDGSGALSYQGPGPGFSSVMQVASGG